MGPGTEDVDLLGRTSLHEADQQLALPRRCRRFDPRRHRRIEGLPRALLWIPHHHESDVSAVPLPQSACPGVRGPADLSRMLLDPRTKSRPDARLAVERVAHRGGGDPQVTSDGGDRRVSGLTSHGAFQYDSRRGAPAGGIGARTHRSPAAR